MRVAALYDIHGNLPALEAVLAEVERESPDLVVFGGDVAAGPLPRETIDTLMTLGRPARFVQGNADRGVVDVLDGREGPNRFVDAWTCEQLEARHRDFLASFEERVVVDGVLFCHATPMSDEPIFTVQTPDGVVLELLGPVEEQVVVCGHTHMQFDRTVGGTRIVNAGSVGMPYANSPGAYWLLLSPDVELRRTEYDVDAAAIRIRESGWSGAAEFAAENVVTVPSAESAVQHFERQAGRG